MNGIHSQFFQVVYRFLLRQCEKLSFMSQPRRAVNREVTVMHLIHYEIGRRVRHWAIVCRLWRQTHRQCFIRLQPRTIVIVPSLRISLPEVENSPAPAVHTHSLGKYTRAFPLTYVEGIELTLQVTSHNGCPNAVSLIPHLMRDFLHSHRFYRLASLTDIIQLYPHALTVLWCKQPEGSLLRRICHLIEVECLRMQGLAHNKKVKK